MFKRFVCILLSLMIVLSYFIVAPALTQPSFEVSSQAVLLVNTDTGTIVFEKNADQKMYTTAFNKIMTAILAFESTDDLDNTMATVTEGALEDENLVFNSSGIEVGEKIAMRDLIASILVGSANDCCNVIAEKVGGSIEEFVNMMNEKAKEIGCTSTNFVNAHGMHDDEQYTTCNDMKKIIEYAIKISGFMEMCSQTSYTISATNINKERKVKTNNLLMLKTSKYYYSPVKGIKYGYTEQGGRCIASTASKNGYNYILILMGGPAKDSDGNSLEDNTAFAESAELYKWAFSNFIIKEIIDENTPVADVEVKSSWDVDHIHAMPETNFIAFVPKDEAEQRKIEYIIDLPESIQAPIKKGQILGSMQIMAGDELLGEINLISTQAAEKSEYVYVIEHIISIIDTSWFKISAIIVVLLIVAYVMIAIISNMTRKKQKGSKEENRKTRKNKRN